MDMAEWRKKKTESLVSFWIQGSWNDPGDMGAAWVPRMAGGNLASRSGSDFIPTFWSLRVSHGEKFRCAGLAFPLDRSEDEP